MAVWRSASTYRADASARSWIYGLARRHAARTWRRRAGEPASLLPLDELGAQAGWGRDPEQIVAALQDKHRLSTALQALPARDREVIVLFDLEGLSGSEVAQLLDLSANAARVRLHRARLRLMHQLQQDTAHA